MASGRRREAGSHAMSTNQAASRRVYRSPRRQQQAAETRAIVLDAAMLLFAGRGWAATGMRDVAHEAGVSVETVYANFRSKSELLMAAIDVAVVGDAQPVPLDQRREFTALGRGSRRQRVRAAARLVSGIHQRTAGVILALREAAASDPEAARRLRAAELRRRSDVEQAATLITECGVPSEVCDGLWAVMDVAVYRLLTDLRGWTAPEYEKWLSDVIDRLLPDPGRRT
jgi:AcrR family transcriptional regulator